MRILFITDEYLPIPSSNGACVSRLVKVAEKAGHCAYVLSVTGKENRDKDRIAYAVYHRKPASFKNRLFGFCQDNGFVEIAFTHAKNIIISEKIESVVCVCRPVETLIAGIKLGSLFSDLKLYGYLLDNLFEMELSNRVKTEIVRFNYKRLFKKFFRAAEEMIILKYYQDTFSRIFNEEDKLIYVGLPSITKSADFGAKKNDRIDIVYTGSLSAEYRNPKGVLEILSEILKSLPNVFVSFYSSGCEEELEIGRMLLGDRFEFNKMVPLARVEELLSSADVLLNISNDLPYAVPGKLFEYFSTGKSILNYCFRQDDPANNEYAKYPLIHNLYAYKENNISDCTKFILESKNKVVDFEDIEDIFMDSTPQYTLQMITGKF